MKRNVFIALSQVDPGQHQAERRIKSRRGSTHRCSGQFLMLKRTWSKRCVSLTRLR